MTAGQTKPPPTAFWRFGSDGERRVVRDVLYRRFPRLASLLADSFDTVLARDVAGPGNLGGENDVVLETIVLLAEANGNLGRVPAGQLHDIVGEAMARSLGHAPEPSSVQEAAKLISAAAEAVDWEALVWAATDFDGGALPEDIRSRSAPFWALLNTPEEYAAVKAVLNRQFAQTAAILSHCLEQADLQDIVYPGQTPEYPDVVREMLVLLSDVLADLGQVPAERLEHVLREADARCFGELPEESRVRRAVDLVIAEHAASEGG
ncbi:hypothetical protein [Amycolatopsis sp. NPDC054798]